MHPLAQRVNINNDTSKLIPKKDNGKDIDSEKEHEVITSPVSPSEISTKELNWKRGSNPTTHRYRLRNRNNPISYKHRAAEYILAQHIFEKVNHMYNDHGKRLSIDTLLHGSDGKSIWSSAECKYGVS